MQNWLTLLCWARRGIYYANALPTEDQLSYLRFLLIPEYAFSLFSRTELVHILNLALRAN